MCLTEGACKGKPGRGGWGAVIRYGEHEKELTGGESNTTNNRMELMAAIQALSALNRPCHVIVSTDSNYVKDGITKWIFGWQTHGWRTADRKPVKNADLWQPLLEDLRPHEIKWQWVKGHSGNTENKQAKKLARQPDMEIGNST